MLAKPSDHPPSVQKSEKKTSKLPPTPVLQRNKRSSEAPEGKAVSRGKKKKVMVPVPEITLVNKRPQGLMVIKVIHLLLPMDREKRTSAENYCHRQIHRKPVKAASTPLDIHTSPKSPYPKEPQYPTILLPIIHH